MSSLLITRPNHDITTNYLYYWSKPVIYEVSKRKIKVVDLKGKRANRKEFLGVIRKIQPGLCILNGHGDEKSVSGYDNEILIELGYNQDVLHGRITYAISCRSARKLGIKVSSFSNTTYLGYVEDFVFLIEESKIGKPLNDKVARLFLEPANKLSISLIKGHSCSDSFQDSQDEFRRNIRKLLLSEVSKEDKEVLPYLYWDMKNQVCLGNRNLALK